MVGIEKKKYIFVIHLYMIGQLLLYVMSSWKQQAPSLKETLPPGPGGIGQQYSKAKGSLLEALVIAALASHKVIYIRSLPIDTSCYQKLMR